VDVAEDYVRLQVQLPWLLSLLANKAKALVEKQGTQPRSEVRFVQLADLNGLRLVLS
jgi:hypothetical protein